MKHIHPQTTVDQLTAKLGMEPVKVVLRRNGGYCHWHKRVITLPLQTGYTNLNLTDSTLHELAHQLDYDTRPVKHGPRPHGPDFIAALGWVVEIYHGIGQTWRYGWEHEYARVRAAAMKKGWHKRSIATRHRPERRMGDGNLRTLDTKKGMASCQSLHKRHPSYKLCC